MDGGYTEDDVKEVARCFTGWTIHRETGEFRFVPLLHDFVTKTVLGTVNPVGGGVSDGCGRFLGGGVVGAQVAGPWPGLDGDSLFDGHDLAITTDIRDVLVQLMQRRLPDEGAAGLFPDFNPGTAPELFIPKT